MRSDTENTIPSVPSIPCGIDGRMGWRIFSLPAKEDAMGRIYFKELPLFHLYDGDLTGTQKLLMTLLLVHLRAELPCADVSGGRDYRSGGAETEGVSARQVKTGKKFARRRNDSAKPCCSESSTGFTDACGFAWFPAKSRGSGKSTPLAYEEDIARRFSSGFRENRIFHHTAKQVFGNANLLRCFHHKNWGGFYEHQK